MSVIKIFIITAILIILLVCLFIFLHYQNKHIVITKYNIVSNNIKNDFKITHLSDIHSTEFKDIIKKVSETQPDIIVITGDLINDKGKNINKMLNLLRELNKITDVFYITGNHERRLNYFEELMDKIKATNTKVLRNETASYDCKGNCINILGLDENQASFEDYKSRKNGNFTYKNYDKEFKIYEQKNGFKLVLSHFPENFDLISGCSYSKYNFDLMLSGHAHGGQFILPFLGSIYSPGQGLFPKYTYGEFGEKPKLIVSRGMGNAEFPFRLFNYPEIISITVTKNQ